MSIILTHKIHCPVKMSKLGSGTFANVFVCDGEAVKKFHTLDDYGIYNPLEIEIMKRINHPNLVHCKKTEIIHEEHEETIDIHMELYEKHNMYKMYKNKTHTWKQVAKHVFQILDAIRCLHDNKIMHLDIKPENIMFDKNNNVKLGDYGLSRIAYDHDIYKVYTDEYRGTSMYVPPESCGKSKRYSGKCDIWALGLTIFYMLQGNYLYTSEREVKGLSRTNTHNKSILSRLRSVVEEATETTEEYELVYNLIYNLLQPIHIKRYSVYKALKSPLFDEFKQQSGYLRSTTLYNEEDTAKLDLFNNKHYKTAIRELKNINAPKLCIDMFNHCLHSITLFKIDDRSFYRQFIATCFWISVKCGCTGSISYMTVGKLNKIFRYIDKSTVFLFEVVIVSDYDICPYNV